MAVATPPADALVMAWAGAGFHKPRTGPGGVAPVPMIPGGKAIKRRCEHRTGKGVRGAEPPARELRRSAGLRGIEGGAKRPLARPPMYYMG